MTKPFFWNPKSVVGMKRDRGKGSVFKCKKKKIPSWTHTFICLAHCDQQSVPDSEERIQLQLQDLGEKKITIAIDAESWEIYDEIQSHFPKLKTAGGFEMLRVGSGKMLQIIACPKIGYTVPFLHAVVHSAKIYLRPLQKDLFSDEENEDTVVCDLTTVYSAVSITFLFCFRCQCVRLQGNRVCYVVHFWMYVTFESTL